MRVELRDLKHHTATVDYDNGSAVLYRSKIDDVAAEISYYYHFSAGGHGAPLPCVSAESGAV